MHGPYSQADAARLRAHGLQVWRVVRIAGPPDLEVVGEAVLDSDTVLVEPRASQDPNTIARFVEAVFAYSSVT